MDEEGLKIGREGFVWHELMSTDPEESEEFYLRVVGVSTARLGDEPGSYQMLMSAGEPVGGIAGPPSGEQGWPSGGPGAHWLAYFGVADVDAAAGSTEKLGGQVLLPPTDVPGMGRAAVLRDPQGATFGVFASGA